MRAYSKQALTFEQQLDKLKDRGMDVANDREALHVLATVSYYRLSGYWYPMRQTSPINGRDRVINLFSTTVLPIAVFRACLSG